MLQIPASNVNIKAATTERMGWIGEGRGMAATAVALLEKRRSR